MKIHRFLFLLLAVLLLVGCAGNGYRYVPNGSEAYISLGVANENGDKSENIYQSEMAPVVWFSSVEEMKEDLQLGRFSDEELKNIARFPKNTEGKIIAPSTDTIPFPTYPERFAVDRLSWEGGSGFPVYWLKADGAGAEATVLTAEKMAEELDRFFWNPKYGTNGIEQEEIMPNANGNISGPARYITNANNQKVKMVHYTFSVDDATFYVLEQYLLDLQQDTPYFMEIWCVKETSNSLVVIYNTDYDTIPFKLSIEEIAQFGFKK